MAKNDTLLIDGILDDRIAQKLPSDKRDEAFEYFAFEQILKDADLLHDDLHYGWVDGGADGGIDGFFTLINGHLLKSPDDFYWPRVGCELDLWLITCKHHETFRQAPLDNFVASLTELLDFGVQPSSFKGIYSAKIIEARQALAAAYRKVSPRLSRFSVNFVYASRGDTSSIGNEVLARSRQAVAIATELFGSCNAKFQFVGAAELVNCHRKVRTMCLELPFFEALTRGERYVLLCRLHDFYKFITDESTNLRRYLFDSNVRAFMGLNRVNEDIRDTLSMEESPDFWWLNNGITILANSATVIGKSIQMEGVQIVNGLQTSESIWRHFKEGGIDPRERAVLVKVIVSTEPEVRDRITRATNNQTPVELQSLHAMDKVQRDIEDILYRSGFFYERQTNYYKNMGHPVSKIVTPIYSACAFVSLVLKNPRMAQKIKSRQMRSEDFNKRVFSEKTPLAIWPVILAITKKSDDFLESVRGRENGSSNNFLKNWRHLLSFVAVVSVLKKFNYSREELCALDPELITVELLRACWNIINENKQVGYNVSKKRFTDRVLEACSKKHGVSGFEMLEGTQPGLDSGMGERAENISPEFIEKVNLLLPDQPWKVGVRHQIAVKLGCSIKSVGTAIKVLIGQGRRMRQRDGIVYDANGTVVARDLEREAKLNGDSG